MAHSSLASMYIGENPNYSNPSYRVGPNLLCLHHMAGVLTPTQCNNALKNGKASIHYAIGNDGTIGWGIDENEVAWHAGNWPINQRSIGIEISNSAIGGDWPVSEAAFNSAVKLVAEIAKRRGFGKLVAGQNIGYHQMYCSTTCVPTNTEVLTKSGWKKISDIEVGEDIATAHIDDMAIRFSPVLDKVPEKTQDTWEIRDIEVTADHRMVWTNQNKKYWRVSEFKDLPRESNYFIPNAGFYKGAGLPLSDNEIRLLVAVQADGHYEHGEKSGKDRITFHLSKQRKIDLLEDLLSGYDYNKYEHMDGTVSFNIKGLKELCEEWLDNKKFTFAWLELSPEQAEVFLDTLLDFDGCKAGNDYSSSIKQNLDVVSAIASINGKGVRYNGDNRLAFTDNMRSITLESEKTRHQRTRVTCVTVESGVFLVRQHGRTTIIGNCPGPTLKARFQELIDKANDINSGDKKPTLTWTKLKSQERWAAALQPTHLWNFDHTDVNKCESIKEYDKGTEFTIYGKVYNDQLASMYLLTEYSFTNKIPNGFNECDMNRKPDLTWTKLDAPVTYLAALDTTHLWDFDYTNVNDCKSVKDYKKGEEVTIYGTCYNAQLASVYLLNEQDFNNKVTHGFNECDMEKKPEPTPPTPEDPTVGILQKIMQFIQHIIDLITRKDK